MNKVNSNYTDNLHRKNVSEEKKDSVIEQRPYTDEEKRMLDEWISQNKVTKLDKEKA